MMMHGAIVLPVVTRGMIDPSIEHSGTVRSVPVGDKTCWTIHAPGFLK